METLELFSINFSVIKYTGENDYEIKKILEAEKGKTCNIKIYKIAKLDLDNPTNIAKEYLEIDILNGERNIRNITTVDKGNYIGISEHDILVFNPELYKKHITLKQNKNFK